MHNTLWMQKATTINNNGLHPFQLSSYGWAGSSPNKKNKGYVGPTVDPTRLNRAALVPAQPSKKKEIGLLG